MNYFKNAWKDFQKMDDWIKYLLIAAIFFLVVSLLWPRDSSGAPGVKLVPVPGTSYYKAVFESFDNSSVTVEELLKSNDPVIVFYSQDWCGYCKKMKPTWQQFKNKYTKCRVIEVDCGKYPELGKKNGIKGYPTIKYHKGGLANPNAVTYSGDRTLQSLLQFAEQQN